MKNYKHLLISLLTSSLLVVTSCDQASSKVESNDSSNGESSSSSILESSSSKEETVKLVFEDGEFNYDGLGHSIYVKNLPTDASVEYTNNNQVEPGKYYVDAKVTYGDGSQEIISARITINKNDSLISAETEQTITEGSEIAYTINNETQTTTSVKFNRVGTYELDLYASANKYYKESNHVTVKVHVVSKNVLNVKFESKEEKFTGSDVVLEASDIPSGYHVEYVNNVGNLPGKYNAVCKVFNDKNELQYSLNAILTIDNENYAPFDQYLKEFFVDYLDGDYLSMNIFLENPENFGFVRDDQDHACWYTYEHIEDYDAAKLADYTELQGYYNQLVAFADQPLSSLQRVSYRRLEEFFQEELAYVDADNPYSIYMECRYIDQFGGYAADFETYMEAYEFRRLQDIVDALDYIKSLPDAFDSYFLYATDKAAAGYAFSDFTIDEMVKYLDGITEQGEDYYLGEYLADKVNACTYLNATQKEQYSGMCVSYIQDYLMDAYSTLATNLKTLKGNVSTEGYLQAYGADGKAQYLFDLKNTLGLPELDPSAYEKALLNAVKKYANATTAAANKGMAGGAITANFERYYDGESLIDKTEPLDMLDYLQNEFAPTIVPELENKPDIEVKYMDETTAAASNAVAYYMKSALDSTDAEHITLNGLKLQDDYNDTLGTLCHEGYPGHLYAYLFDKQIGLSDIGTIMTSTAHGEGWATYVTLQLYKFIKENVATEGAKLYCDYLYNNDLVGYLLYTYYDFEIHYNGWSVSKVKNHMNSLGYSGNSYGQEIFRTLIEMPAGYAPYGYGMLHMVELHDKAKAQLKDAYNEIEINTAILSHGWCPLYELDQIVDEYIADTKFLYSVED